MNIIITKVNKAELRIVKNINNDIIVNVYRPIVMNGNKVVEREMQETFTFHIDKLKKLIE